MQSVQDFQYDRCDTYMYFASDILPDNPVIVEVGSIYGAHGIKLCMKFDGKLTMIVYEAGLENHASLVRVTSTYLRPQLKSIALP